MVQQMRLEKLRVSIKRKYIKKGFWMAPKDIMDLTMAYILMRATKNLFIKMES